MASNPVPVVIDTNNVDRCSTIDDMCGVIDLIVCSLGDYGVGDKVQLAKKTRCQEVTSKLADHGTSDEEVFSFIRSYAGSCHLQRIMDDPADLRLLVCARRHAVSTLVSCDRRLLRLADDISQKHLCFKAAVHETHIAVGGLFNDPGYTTKQMFDIAGDDPFYHYAVSSRCEACDGKRQCHTRNKPPTGT